MNSLRRRAGPAIVAAATIALCAPAVIRADGQVTVLGQVDVSPLVVTLSLSTNTSVVGKTVRADVVVTNIGADRVSDVVVELRASTVGLLIRNLNPQTIPRLKPGGSATVGYAICGQTAGSYIVLAKATLAGTSVDSSARLLTINAGTKRGC